MKALIKKYRGIILLVFLGLLISLIDNIVLKGFFKGEDLLKHLVYICVLLGGLFFVIYILVKD
ncbi:MAG: hypothetical protein EVA36_01155 [Flavobacteriales bacterium]|nr:hypothetical protein [Flavobacteriaceae bacterium]RZP12189.1 MAG: hypothetical protein EVA36_01155 [Flavobacteriales bacterium]